MSKVRIAVNGAAGRMGARILALAAAGDFDVAGKFDGKADASAQIQTLSASQLSGKGALIDFSSPEGTAASAQAASTAGWGLVVGTTGLEAKEMELLKIAAQKIPVVVSSNMSVGVNLVAELLELLAKKMPTDFDAQITEAHHTHKKDAPSGTAIMLLNAIAASKGWDARRTQKEKERIHSIREGEIVGDHSVLFSGPAETIEIRHHAKSRDIFAGGALVAARFAASAKPGLYNMRDVLQK